MKNSKSKRQAFVLVAYNERRSFVGLMKGLVLKKRHFFLYKFFINKSIITMQELDMTRSAHCLHRRTQI